MRQLLFILTALTTHLTAFGQHDFGLKANGGLSYLLTKVHSTGVGATTQKFYFVPSGHGGLFYTFHLGDKSSLGTEFLFTQIEGKEYDETPATDIYGNPTGQFLTGNTWQHISYFSIPIYYGYNFKKLNINLGLQISFPLASSGYAKSTYMGTVYYETSADKLPIKDYDFGARAGLCFTLTKKFSLETTYYYGLTDIYKYNDVDFTWTVQQITVGLRYKLFSRGGQTSETEKK